MVYDWLADHPVDPLDARDAGVVDDRRVTTREGAEMRIVAHVDPVGGESYEFPTNGPDLPPGILVELCRRRWEAEKVSDGIKHKLGEKKAWGTTMETREAQARCIATAHNLLKLYEHRSGMERGVRNHHEDARRAKRAEQAAERCAAASRPISTLVTASRRATQCSVKFIRWPLPVSERRDRGSRRRDPPTHPLRNAVIPLPEHRSGLVTTVNSAFRGEQGRRIKIGVVREKGVDPDGLV